MSLRHSAFFFLLFSVWALFAAPVSAENNPFEDLVPETESTPPSRFLLVIEWIEVAKIDWITWVGNPDNSLDGKELRDHVQSLIEQNTASIFDLSIMPVTFGSRGQINSTDFFLYPRQYGGSAEMAKTGDLTVPIGVASFECRFLGWTAEVDPQFSIKEKLMSLNYKTEYVEKTGLSSAGRAENEVKTPIFSTASLAGATDLLPGETTFLGSLSRETAPGRTILAFIRCDRHPLEESRKVATNEDKEG